MLAEILANPVAWPLWAVLVFAASMYPLGFMLPGCVCCGPSGCTQCGTFAVGYAAGQSEWGAMCCDGTIATSVTLRITNVGPATSSDVVRGTGATYTKTTTAFSCSSLSGDYVLPLQRINSGSYAMCSWKYINYSSCAAFADNSVAPFPYNPNGGPDTASFPNYYLSADSFGRVLSGSRRTQTCSGYPGIESCDIGSTDMSTDWFVYLENRPYVIPSVQKCNPAGTVFSASTRVVVTGKCGYPSAIYGFDTGCTVSVELV
jgi:hypothetical protein